MEKYNAAFWLAIDRLVRTSKLVIDRPKGTSHPRFSEIIYPVDYGYLKNTRSMDGHEIDVWKGTKKHTEIDAVMVTIDLLKKDSEIKILMGCSASEKKKFLSFHNKGEQMKGLMIKRKINGR